MKLNNALNKCIVFITIGIIFVYHYCIHSGLEKIFSQTYFNYDDIKRPSKQCNANGSQPVSCVGVPSSHTELTTLISYLLYKYNFIPLWISIVSIIGVSLQRVITNNHTGVQVFIGIVIGFIYAHIYVVFNLSICAFMIVLGLGILLAVLSIYKIESLLHSPIPDWVDKSMIVSIQKKQNIPFYLKVLTIYSNAFLQNRTFVNWKNLEIYLDELIDTIHVQKIRYDAVVGIKTGGAIISDYVSNKLQLPNYKVKLSRADHNCNKQPSHSITDTLQKRLLNKYGEYSICEGIYDNLKGQNIILIDEMVSSGTTMSETIKYLKDEKHVNIIQPMCISFSKENFEYTYKMSVSDAVRCAVDKIEYTLPTLVLVWPWGYDN